MLKPKKSKEEQKPKLSRKEKAEIKKQERIRAKEENKYNNRLKKEHNKREQQRIENENKPITWIYNGKADITIGESVASNVAKIILIFLIIALIVLGVLGFLNKNRVIDYITKPAVILTDKDINLEVGKDFDYKNYLAEQDYPKRYKIYYPKNEDVNTNKVGTYKVNYKLKSSAGVNSTVLTVNVVDTTPPDLKLKEDMIKLTRGNATKKFNPKKYIKDYSDNYDKKEDLILTHTENFDWSKDKVEVVYSVKDKSNNVTEKKLLISVNDPPKEPEPPKNNSENSNNSGNSSNNSGGSSNGNSSNNNSGNNNSSGGNNNSHSNSGGAYISGVHNITVSVGSDFSAMVSKLTSGVQGSGYVTCDYSSVNLTSPGSYTVTFSSSDGVTKRATVTVK